MALTTRRATGDDARAVAEAHVRAWQVAYQGIVPADFLDALDADARAVQWQQNLTEEVLSDGVTPAPLNYVAEVGTQVIGFACVGIWRDAPENATMAELWAMYVHPDHWGTGAGYALMQNTMQQFKDDEISTGYLWVLDDNGLARRFYERQGWHVNDQTKDEPLAGLSITERRYSIELT